MTITTEYTVYKVDSNTLLDIVPLFNQYGPGIQYGLDSMEHLSMWLDKSKYCYGYLAFGKTYGIPDSVPCGIVALYNDESPDPHFPYKSISQTAFTAIKPSYAGAACALYQHIKQDLRTRGVESLVVSRQISKNEIRSRLYKL